MMDENGVIPEDRLKETVITKNNTEEYAPTQDYNPATKKYVDDSVSAAGGGDMLKNVYDQDGDDVVDNAKALEGHNASYFAAASALDGYAQKNHAVNSEDYGLATTTEYGHVKIANHLTQPHFSRGYALAANQGRILSERIAVLENAKPQPPALTAVTPDGTQIGTSGWTGTGFFCTASGNKYTAGSEVSAAISGFQRFCLRFSDADSRAWTFWTPYLDINGKAYPFFFSETRGLYDGLIPATTQTAEQIVSSIRWENETPRTIRYGRLSNMFFYTNTDGEDHFSFYNDVASLMDTSGGFTELDTKFLQNFTVTGISLPDLTEEAASHIYLRIDVDGNGYINISDPIDLEAKVKNGTPLAIDGIDNFTA